MVEPSEEHSVLCHLKFMAHRVKNNEVITSTRLDNIQGNCKNAINRVERKLNRCRKPKQMEAKGQWINGLCRASENQIGQNFGKWKNADKSLYSANFSTEKRRGCMKDTADSYRKDFMEIFKYANELKAYWQTEKENGNSDAAAELDIVQGIFDDNDVQDGWKHCVNELDNIVDLLTPQLRVD